MRQSKPRADAGGDPRGATLGDLLRLAGVAPSTPPELNAIAAPVVAPEGPPPLSFAKKVIVRTSRKGHGGKTATEVLGVVAGHEELVATLKGVFGVGVRREEDAIVLQGDQVARLVPWLEAAGARVIRG